MDDRCQNIFIVSIRMNKARQRCNLCVIADTILLFNGPGISHGLLSLIKDILLHFIEHVKSHTEFENVQNLAERSFELKLSY